MLLELELLKDKLYGNLEELWRTAAFVRATGIFVCEEEEEPNIGT